MNPVPRPLRVFSLSVKMSVGSEPGNIPKVPMQLSEIHLYAFSWSHRAFLCKYEENNIKYILSEKDDGKHSSWQPNHQY